MTTRLRPHFVGGAVVFLVKSVGTTLCPAPLMLERFGADFLRDLYVFTIQPEMCERALIETRHQQIHMFLQTERGTKFQCRVTVCETRQIVNPFLKQADKLASL